MNVSPRTILELVSAAVLAGLLVWQTLTAASLRTKLADARTDVQKAQLKVQASDVSYQSCKAALGTASAATTALAQATESANGLASQALQARQDRAPVLSAELTRLLSVRPGPDGDCQSAYRLGQGAWEDGQ